MMNKANTSLKIIFHIGIIFIIFQSYTPVKLTAHPKMLSTLLSTKPQKVYVSPVVKLTPFKAYLPERGVISIITDNPLKESVKQREFWYDAQNFLAPLIIRKEQTEETALVHCSNSEIANKRLAELGYMWKKEITPGKGVAVRKQ